MHSLKSMLCGVRCIIIITYVTWLHTHWEESNQLLASNSNTMVRSIVYFCYLLYFHCSSTGASFFG